MSSHYDPMIAKLIVHGATREIAIQKLQTALQQYEIAGPITNVEFLKSICQNAGFIAGEVETGFIPKRKDELFKAIDTPPEVFAQAALGVYLSEALAVQPPSPASNLDMGFTSTTQGRDFRFVLQKGDGSTAASETTAHIQHTSAGLFDVSINGTTFRSVASNWSPSTRTLVSYFPHTRLDTRLVLEDGNLTLFQHGQQYRLQCASPAWIEKALGIKDNAHSVLAPMPCKILRVLVEEGEGVKRDQPLVVIESMKMETVIRSPQDGVVARVVHRQGVRGFF